MLLRVVGGTVAVGREAEFVDVCRGQVAAGARAPGLVGFFVGYRRSAGTERFILASTWRSEGDARRTTGTSRSFSASTVLAKIAHIDRIEQYELVEPAYGGIVDAPGGVVRVTSALIKPGRRDDLYGWLASQARASHAPSLLLGWAIGERDEGERRRVISLSVWPSPLVIEALTEPGREGLPLFAAVDEFVTDATTEQYQAVGLDLPRDVADPGSRRILAARFGERDAADRASLALSAAIASAREAAHSIAALGSPGTSRETRSWILVARVSSVDYAAAERLITDHGGEVVLTGPEADTDERERQPYADMDDRRRTPPGAGWSAAPAD
jgi:hypothetical protein